MSKYTADFIDMDAHAWTAGITDTDSSPQEMPGIIRRVYRPGYGMGVYRYVQNKAGSAMLVGSGASFVAAVTLTSTGAGTTTSITDTGLGANDYQYDLVICKDDAGAAGATPEGTGGFCTSNTATSVNIDPDSPFGAATATSDTFEVITNFHVIACADGDLQQEFAGIVQAASLADDYWGWVQVTGRCAKALFKDQITVAPLQALVCDAGTLNISSTDNLNVLVALSCTTVSNDAGRLDYGVVDLHGYLPEYGGSSLNVTV